MHYKRWAIHGDPNIVLTLKKARDPHCTIAGCGDRTPQRACAPGITNACSAMEIRSQFMPCLRTRDCGRRGRDRKGRRRIEREREGDW